MPKKTISPVHFSMLSNEWSTPAKLFNALDREFHFTLDPCASVENAKCAKFYTKKDDGLSKNWDNEITFMNPPYGRDINTWVWKASQTFGVVVCLIPARTDTRYWHKWVFPYADEIRFIEGRIVFEGAKWNAPFPSAVVVFRPVLDRKFFTVYPVITKQEL